MHKQLKKQATRAQKLLSQAIYRHKLIEDGDKILIGLSGGIDSLVMVHLIANRKKHYPVNFQLTAVHVNITNIPYTVDRKYLEDFTKSLDVPLIWYEEQITIDPAKVKKNLCFICSWNRRKFLFQLAEKLGYNKLALAHHRDDAIETLLLNMIYHGSISSLPAKLKMFDGNLILIRPMIYVSKPLIQAYAQFYNIKAKVKECVFANKTKRRTDIAKLIEYAQQLHPQAKHNMFKSMANIHPDYLPT